MSIRPPYAEAILDGSKQVEFRKRRLADDVTTVLIYMTAPVMAVVGHFTVAGQVVDAPAALWERFEAVAGIDADGFHDYFAASDEGVGIVIEDVTIYDTPVPLQQVDPGGRAPQSYKYLPAGALAGV
jgi:predicted transcriptional regulator